MTKLEMKQSCCKIKFIAQSLITMMIFIAKSASSESITVAEVSAYEEHAKKFSSDLNFAAEVKQGQYRKLGMTLAMIYEDYISESYDSVTDILSVMGIRESARTLRGSMLLIDAYGPQGGTENLMSNLEEVGFVTTGNFKHVVSGFMPIRSLPAVNIMNSVSYLTISLMVGQEGAVQNEALASMSVRNIAQVDLDGSGVTVGVLSSTFNAIGGYEADVATGDLPEGINVLFDDVKVGTQFEDEGRKMLQLIHDIAPGANLVYRSVMQGQADFAAGILEMADEANGARILVDDIIYLAEPMFQDGIIAQTVDEVVSQGVSYFTPSGNNLFSWESPFNDSGLKNAEGLTLHDFGDGATRLKIGGWGNSQPSIVFNWDEPYFSTTGTVGSSSDIDIYIYNEGSNTPFLKLQTNNTDGDPIEIGGLDTLSISVLEIEIILVSGDPPGLMKWVVHGLGRYETLSVDSGRVDFSTVYGKANAVGSFAVGAVHWMETPGFGASLPTEIYSSRGGTTVLFDETGGRLAGPVIRQQPRAMGPDGVSTTFPEPFFGTSASASNVAAVAALVLGLKTYLKPRDIYSILETTAEDMGSTVGFDFATGHGFVNAYDAVEEASFKGYFIDCGGSTYYDYLYSSGRAVDLKGAGLVPNGVANTDDEEVFLTERVDQSRTGFSYNIPALVDGIYVVTMSYMEPWFDRPGGRLFDVIINGVTVLDDYDIYEKAGSKHTAVTEEVLVACADAKIDIDFVSVTDAASVNAISVAYLEPLPTFPLYINAGGGTVHRRQLDSEAVSIALSDRFFTAGDIFRDERTKGNLRIGGTVLADVFRTARVDECSQCKKTKKKKKKEKLLGKLNKDIPECQCGFMYTIPLPMAGTYKFSFSFSENHFQATGSRVFNIRMNNETIFEGLDIFDKAKSKDKVVTLTRTTTITEGGVSIQFISSKDAAFVNEIGVELLSLL